MYILYIIIMTQKYKNRIQVALVKFLQSISFVYDFVQLTLENYRYLEKVFGWEFDRIFYIE